MPAFAPYSKPDRLENIPIVADIKSYGNLTLLLTCGVRNVFEAVDQRRSGRPEHRHNAIFTLPDGRLNAGVHLPLLAHRYKYLSVLGEGASAQVVLVEDTFHPDRELKAIKVLKRQHNYLGRREIRALQYLQMCAGQENFLPSMVRLSDTFVLGGHCCLVTDQLLPRLLDWVAQSVQTPRALFTAEVRKLAYQLLSTVAFMHTCGVVHADIKPDNILMVKPQGMRVALVDFGGALSITETDLKQIVTEVQTLPYRAPEVALGISFGQLIDEWSVGVVIAEAMLKRPLFPQSTTPIELLMSMVSQLGPIPSCMVEHSDLARSYDLASLLQVNQHVLDQESTSRRHSSRRNLPRRTLESLPGCVDQSWCKEHSQLVDDLLKVDATLADLVSRLLVYDPEKRLTAKDALHHTFFHPLKGLEIGASTERFARGDDDCKLGKLFSAKSSRHVHGVNSPNRPNDAFKNDTGDGHGVAISIENSKVVDVVASADATDTHAKESSGQTSNTAKKKPRRDARESKRTMSKPWWVV